MSPKSETLTQLTETASTVTAKSITHEKEIKRDKIFARFDRPFYLDQKIHNLWWLTTGHAFAIYMFYLNFTGKAPWSTLVIEFTIGYFGGLGITVGCHRYWTHKTFKAKLPLQILLMIMQTISNQYPIHKWCMDHRIHHKYTDSDADPHNSLRGFFYSHMGWLFLPKRKELQDKLKTFDMSDLENDPIVRFQSKWYWTLTVIFHFIIPTLITYYIWEIPILYCWSSNCRRYVGSLHFTWCVNSFAHMWGDKPYDKSITSRENAFVSLVAIGEGWHNYHHTFPWDYKASEFGWRNNPSTIFIDFFASIGWAYDMKTVSQKMLKERLRRTGDGSHADAKVSPIEDHAEDFDYTTPADVTELMKSMDKPIWGWGDETLPDDFRKVTKILSPGGLH